MKKYLLIALLALVPQFALAGSQTYSTPGNYTFTVPSYGTLTVELWGGGGGGGAVVPDGRVNPQSTPGGKSTFSTVEAGGGEGGISEYVTGQLPGATTAQGGVASGGDINLPGGISPPSQYYPDHYSSTAGSAPYGGAGGAGGDPDYWCPAHMPGILDVNGRPGVFPGGGGGGAEPAFGGTGGGAGAGAYAKKTYAQSELAAGTTVPVTVGTGGTGGHYGTTGWCIGNWGYWYWDGGTGASGQVRITWTDPPQPLQCTGSPQVFSYTGSNQTVSVPANARSIDVKLWGAGGGSSAPSTYQTSRGGGGGYTSGTLSVSPGDTLTLIVGQGGVSGSGSRTYGGGGAGFTFCNGWCLYGSSGGGRSALRLSSGLEVMTAGGGGGGMSGTTGYNSTYTGAGGGAAGGNGVNASIGYSTGGTQTAGGSQVPTSGWACSPYAGSSGSQYQGGDGPNSCGARGGGGGGWYGGAAGVNGSSAGGSGHCDSSVSNCSTVGGSGTSPGNSTDPNLPSGVGSGASPNGGNGAILITCSQTPPNSAPTAPTISGPTSGLTKTSYTYSFRSTDPDGDTLRYAIDWDDNGNIDEYVPALGYVASGASSATTHSWNSSNTQTFKARAQDSQGNNSGWSSYTVNMSPNAPTVLLTATPSSITSGQSSTLEWSSDNANSCTGTNFSTGGATAGSVSVSPIVTRAYTVTCTGQGNQEVSDSKTVTVTCTPTYTCTDTTTVHSSCPAPSGADTSCPSGLICSAGSSTCVAPPAPVGTLPSPGGSVSGNAFLQAVPSILRSGNTTSIRWGVDNVKTNGCTIRADLNADLWQGPSSGTSYTGAQTSRRIFSQTTYTLACTGLDDSTVSTTAVVNIVPEFQEQ